MKFLYRLFEGVSQTPDNQKHKTYGIRAYRQNGHGWLCAAEVSDVSSDQKFVLRLVWWYNQLQLAPEHLKDIVQDAIVYENSNISKALS